MLLRILILICVLITLPDLYIYYMYARRWTRRRWLRLLWFVPSLLLAIAAGFIIGHNDMKPEHQAWVSLFMFFFLACCAPKALFMLWDGVGHALNWLFSRGAKRRDEEESCVLVRICRIIGMALAIFALGVLCFGYFVGRHYYVIHRQTFYFPDLPKRYEGYRIAHISDMHIGTFRDGHE
ncbi:MAG: hypothetical protein K2H92_07365, partial [Bacteroidaceae bacterium]|nr:hypothetical protein [Bacteroidaceae bacterium]